MKKFRKIGPVKTGTIIGYRRGKNTSLSHRRTKFRLTNKYRKIIRNTRKVRGGNRILSYNDYNIIRNIAKKVTNKSISYFAKYFNALDATKVYIRAKMSNDKNIIELMDAAHIKYEDKYLLHSFRDISPKPIFDSGKLFSISKQTSPITSQWYRENNVNQERDDYKNVLFTTFFYKDSKILPNNSTMYLFLDIDLLKDSEECAPNTTYICNRWNFAKHNSNCIPYTGDLNKWIEFVKYTPKEYSEQNRLNIIEYEEIEENEVNEFITMEDRMNGIRMPFGTPDNEVTIKYSKDMNGKCVKSEISLKKYLKAIVIFSDDEDDYYGSKKLQEMYPEYNWIII